LPTWRASATAGEAVDVSAGYLRNYLVPRKLAQPATKGALEEAERKREASEKAAREALERAGETAALLSKTVLTINHRAGEDGKLFGSVTSKEIADAIAEARGLRIGEEEDPPRRPDPRGRHLHGRDRSGRRRHRHRQDDRRRAALAAPRSASGSTAASQTAVEGSKLEFTVYTRVNSNLDLRRLPVSRIHGGGSAARRVSSPQTSLTCPYG